MRLYHQRMEIILFLPFHIGPYLSIYLFPNTLARIPMSMWQNGAFFLAPLCIIIFDWMIDKLLFLPFMLLLLQILLSHVLNVVIVKLLFSTVNNLLDT